MSYTREIRFKLKELEDIQWQADSDQIISVLGQLPDKSMLLLGAHILARLLGQLDLTTLAALVNETAKETE